MLDCYSQSVSVWGDACGYFTCLSMTEHFVPVGQSHENQIELCWLGQIRAWLKKITWESWKIKTVNSPIPMNKIKCNMLEVPSLEGQVSTWSLRDHRLDVIIITATVDGIMTLKMITYPKGSCTKVMGEVIPVHIKSLILHYAMIIITLYKFLVQRNWMSIVLVEFCFLKRGSAILSQAVRDDSVCIGNW